MPALSLLRWEIAVFISDNRGCILNLSREFWKHPVATEVQLAFNLSWTPQFPAMETSRTERLNLGRTCKSASSNGREPGSSLESRADSPTPLEVEVSPSIRGARICILFRRGPTRRRLTWIG